MKVRNVNVFLFRNYWCLCLFIWYNFLVHSLTWVVCGIVTINSISFPTAPAIKLSLFLRQIYCHQCERQKLAHTIDYIVPSVCSERKYLYYEQSITHTLCRSLVFLCLKYLIHSCKQKKSTPHAWTGVVINIRVAWHGMKWINTSALRDRFSWICGAGEWQSSAWGEEFRGLAQDPEGPESQWVSK